MKSLSFYEASSCLPPSFRWLILANRRFCMWSPGPLLPVCGRAIESGMRWVLL